MRREHTLTKTVEDESDNEMMTLGCKVTRRRYNELCMAGVSVGLTSRSDALRLAIERFVEDCAQGKVNASSLAEQVASPHQGNEGGAGQDEVVHGEDVVECDGDRSESDRAGDVPVRRLIPHDRQDVAPVRHPHAQDADSKGGEKGEEEQTLDTTGASTSP